MLKLPAFGKELAQARRTGMMPSRLVLVTDWWTLARIHQRLVNCFALVCDPLAKPYDFSLLWGCEVLLAHVGEDALGAAERIARANPRALTVVSGPEEVRRLLGHLQGIIDRRAQAGEAQAA